ncbi:hypothetical protein [Streptomyces noursei]|uniref:hypothetical protein n=1 Tax=Streptomyces noursei TaxID=1971 RepID=UPI001679EDEC|nr:hypothetical protein [Streptomyces noursei]MCZ1021264.1 hypothetical protein [Streptomyces noursei]GGX54828.1 hypothetical protein GCM10010341_89820 [Streptomyces noursei]
MTSTTLTAAGTPPDANRDKQGLVRDRVFPYLRERPLPLMLYRFDRRGPDVIFPQGFTTTWVNPETGAATTGTTYDLAGHVRGTHRGRTGFISTSSSIVGALEMFKIMQRNETRGWRAEHGRVYSQEMWLYCLVPSRYYVSVEDNILESRRRLYCTAKEHAFAASQREWVAPFKIPPPSLVSAWHTRLILDLDEQPFPVHVTGDGQLELPDDRLARLSIKTWHLEFPVPREKKAEDQDKEYDPFADPDSRYDGLIGYQAKKAPGSSKYSTPKNWAKQSEYWDGSGKLLQPSYPFGQP